MKISHPKYVECISSTLGSKIKSVTFDSHSVYDDCVYLWLSAGKYRYQFRINLITDDLYFYIPPIELEIPVYINGGYYKKYRAVVRALVRSHGLEKPDMALLLHDVVAGLIRGLNRDNINLVLFKFRVNCYYSYDMCCRILDGHHMSSHYKSQKESIWKMEE